MSLDSRLLEYVVNEESYADGQEIFAEGSSGEWIYIVLEGRVKIRKKTKKGALAIVTLKEGAIFGELVFLQMTQGKRTASVVAVGDVNVGILDTHRISTELNQVSPMLRKLIGKLAERLQEATEKLARVSIQ